MVIITGDTHGDFRRFSTANFPVQKEMTRDDRIIICGDFGGVWSGSNEEEWWLNWLAEKNFTICFVDGNHEGFYLLSLYPIVDYCGGKAHKIRDNIYHLMRGYIFDFEGKKYFAFGGARSHDISGGIFEADDKKGIAKAKRGLKSFRINHVSWWEEEMPNEDEMKRGINSLESVNFNVDYVISHTLPTAILKSRWNFMENDALSDYFNSLMRDINFKKWYCGHYHVDEQIFGRFELLYEKFTEIPIDNYHYS